MSPYHPGPMSSQGARRRLRRALVVLMFRTFRPVVEWLNPIALRIPWVRSAK